MDSAGFAGDVILEPRLDMEFESHEDAYSFYKEYAKSVGFGTAKLSSRRSRASKEFIDAKFSCIRYGNKQQSDDAINPRPSPKIGCKASMHVKRKPNGKWFVYSFIKEHNHELLPAQAHFFRSHRAPDPVKNDVRVKRKKNLSSVSRLFNAYQNVDFLEGYRRNQPDKGRRLVLEAGDAQVLLEFFMCMQDKDPEFFYAIDLNEEHRLRNVFWVDAKGIKDYKSFGDIVSFDMTCFSNKYKIPLVLFVGVNHHVQPTLLGCALIADETVFTFVWLMQTWFVAMGERAPQVILTDQDNDLKAAVSTVFPNTRHCFCLWNVLERLPRNLDYWSLWQDTFMKKFCKCIYRSWTEEEFEKKWYKLINRFHLRETQWIQSLYEERKHWAPSFMRGISFAGLSTPSRSESPNSLFDRYVQAETSLRELLERYRLMLEDRYEEEAKADFDAWHETPELRSPSPFEKQMSFVYTREIFKKFQVEILGAAACHLKKENECQTTTLYTVRDFEDDHSYMVEWNEQEFDIYCSCHSFEYKGYLCRHAIVVLQMSGVFSIPKKYILQRWTNAARFKRAIGESSDEIQSKLRRFNDLCRRAIILAEEGSLSQESYNFAVCAMKEALKQCAGIQNSVEDNIRSENPAIQLGCIIGGESPCSSTAKENFLDPRLSNTNTVAGRAEAGNEKESSKKNVARKRKPAPQPGTLGVATTQAVFPQMDGLDTRLRQSQNIPPTQFHNMIPVMFHTVTPFHNLPAAHQQHNHDPR